MHVVQYQVGSCYAPDVVVQKAASRLGEPNYDLFGNNCEHFSHWCKTGKKTSGQINDAIGMAGGLGGGILTGMAVDALLPLVIPELIVIGLCAAAVYAGGKVVGEFTTELFTDPTDYETA